VALRDTLIERAQPYLEEGERVQYVFRAQRGPSPYWFLLASLLFLWTDYRIVVVTDRDIMILEAGKVFTSQPKGRAPLARLPRGTRFGPLRGLWGSTEATGEKLYVHKRFHRDAAAADALADRASPAP
jgi:hypothetical protein